MNSNNKKFELCIDDDITSSIRQVNQTDHLQRDSRKNRDFSIIRFLRQTMGLSQKQFADLCEISPIYCYELECGKSHNPSPEVIERIAKACEIKPSTIQFFLNKQKGTGQLYQKCLIALLEKLESVLDDSL